jgi:hypothetical protein
LQLTITASFVLDAQGRPINGGQNYAATISPGGAVVAAAAAVPADRIAARAVDALLADGDDSWVRVVGS